jgi:hypothetical protein
LILTEKDIVPDGKGVAFNRVQLCRLIIGVNPDPAEIRPKAKLHELANRGRERRAGSLCCRTSTMISPRPPVATRLSSFSLFQAFPAALSERRFEKSAGAVKSVLSPARPPLHWLPPTPERPAGAAIRMTFWPSLRLNLRGVRRGNL